jgi:hypothetical protein
MLQQEPRDGAEEDPFPEMKQLQQRGPFQREAGAAAGQDQMRQDQPGHRIDQTADHQRPDRLQDQRRHDHHRDDQARL